MVSPHIYSVHGIILRRRNIGEADRVLTILTQEAGKIRILAKGIRKITSRRSGHVELFHSVHLTIHKGKTFDILTEATASTSSFADAQLIQIARAYYVCELVDQMVPDNQEQREVFDILKSALTDIRGLKDERSLSNRVYAFALELLWCLGFLPRNHRLKADAVEAFIEEIIEKKIKTRKLLHAT